MLTRLVSGGEDSNTVLVSVTSQDSLLARDIIKTFLASPSLNTQSVLVRTGPSCLCGDLALSKELDLTDVLGWRSGGDPVKFPDVVYSTVEPGKENIVIDNLTDLLIFYKLSTVTQFIRKIRQSCGRNNKIFFVVHKDCLAAEVLEDIVKFVTTVINISDIKSDKLCKIQHKKPGGRLVNSTEVIKLDTDRNIITSEYKEQVEKVVEEEEEEEAAVEKLTTFSLGTIKQTEKEAKEKLVLPFYKEGQVKISGESNSKIYYEPDSGDDWDDEDPDDDLDF